MPLEVKKQNRETNQSLIRRFTKAVQGSGILLRARKIRFKDRDKSEDGKKRTALRRLAKKREYKKLKKLGKISQR